MSKQLETFLIDVLTGIDPFKDVVSHIFIRRNKEDSTLEAAAKARDGSISIRAISKKPIKEFEYVACLGNLSYLKSVLISPYMKADGKMKLGWETASNGKSQALRYIEFSGGKGFKTFYQATDPFVNQLGRIEIKKNQEWPVAFHIGPAVVKNFDDIYKIHLSAPRTGSDLDDIFRLSFTEKGIEGVFGDNDTEASVILSDIAEAEEGTDKMSGLFQISRFRSILKQIGKNEALAYQGAYALMIDTETTHSNFQFVMQAKKMADL